MMMPFSIETVSVGRPNRFQLRIATGLPNVDETVHPALYTMSYCASLSCHSYANNR